MFGFNKKNNTETSNYDRVRSIQEAYWNWRKSEEGKRIEHLQTLIMKTYETVNIKTELCGHRLSETYISSDYLEDFRVFFKPEVFNKLSDWCKEYETLRAKEITIWDNL